MALPVIVYVDKRRKLIGFSKAENRLFTNDVCLGLEKLLRTVTVSKSDARAN